MPEPWDQRLANQAAIAEQMKKLGGVVLDTKKKPQAGFTQPQQPEAPRDDS